MTESTPIDLDDAEATISNSMASDVWQTPAEYRAGCAALEALLQELRAHREREASGGWVAVSERLPDTDVWVLAINHRDDCVQVQLEFTDDSEGRGEPYWAMEGAAMGLHDYPHWMPLPAPPKPEPAATTGEL